MKTMAPDRVISPARQLALIALFFFLFGFVTWINGALIPYLRIACQLAEWQTYLVTFAFYIAYTVASLPAVGFLQKVGTVKGIQAGLLLMAAGCLVFLPAAMERTYAWFLVGLFLLGTGLTILQIAVNPYVTVLGPHHRAAQRMSIMGACNKFAGMLAPLIFGAILLTQAASGLENTLSKDMSEGQLQALANRVIVPYAILAAFLTMLALLVSKAGLPPIQLIANQQASEYQPLSESAYSRRAALGFMAIFCSVGAEVVAGDTIGNYGLYHGLSISLSAKLTSATLTSMMVGYLVGIVITPRLVGQSRAFLLSNLLGMLLLGAVIIAPGKFSVFAVASLGFANALLWPAIWPQTLRGLGGKQLHHASALLIMGIAGGAIMPLLYGWAATILDNRWAYLIIAPCYLYNMWFWYAGHIETRLLRKEAYTNQE
ncbi:glucose/galactose MFS transporter [Parapedobacter pyrenivorans]|uniref:Glucose/galactose MFS transporter n=1 Tax=Parapedobacter pyrenivorans TaxID=1305674 RepID=A0A917HZI3_9SPHI|nr:glucose/galactose MFS transporter [Parapedobacter pyrenivorans]GGG99664.1 glucose/galactose MFS transporter [Parapedobacter pyrenivorans]